MYKVVLDSNILETKKKMAHLIRRLSVGEYSGVSIGQFEMRFDLLTYANRNERVQLSFLHSHTVIKIYHKSVLEETYQTD